MANTERPSLLRLDMPRFSWADTRMCPRRPGEFCGRWMRDVGTSTDSMKADIKEAIKKEKQRQELLLTFATSPKRESWSIKISEASKELTYDLRDVCKEKCTRFALLYNTEQNEIKGQMKIKEPLSPRKLAATFSLKAEYTLPQWDLDVVRYNFQQIKKAYRNKPEREDLTIPPNALLKLPLDATIPENDEQRMREVQDFLKQRMPCKDNMYFSEIYNECYSAPQKGSALFSALLREKVYKLLHVRV